MGFVYLPPPPAMNRPRPLFRYGRGQAVRPKGFHPPVFDPIIPNSTRGVAIQIGVPRSIRSDLPNFLPPPVSRGSAAWDLSVSTLPPRGARRRRDPQQHHALPLPGAVHYAEHTSAPVPPLDKNVRLFLKLVKIGKEPTPWAKDGRFPPTILMARTRGPSWVWAKSDGIPYFIAGEVYKS